MPDRQRHRRRVAADRRKADQPRREAGARGQGDGFGQRRVPTVEVAEDGGRIELLNSLKGKQPMTPQVFVSWLSELKFYDPRLRLLYSVVNVPRPAVERRDSTGCKASAYVNPWAVWQDR